MPRRTKIVATLGPATDNIEILTSILLAGVDLVRINCSHNNKEQIKLTINKVREVSVNNNIEIPILLDLQGPKIRISKFKTGEVNLVKNKRLVITSNYLSIEIQKIKDKCTLYK